jgi:hypothetical protein
MVVQMADDMNGTRSVFISEQKRDTLLQTLSMFANPFDDQSTTISPLEILPRNQLHKKQMIMFKKRTKKKDYFCSIKMRFFRCSYS